MDAALLPVGDNECGCLEPHRQVIDGDEQDPCSGDVRRNLHYFSPPPDNERPIFIVTESNGVGFKNYPCIDRRVLIRDVRMHPSHPPFHLSTHSFQLLKDTPPFRQGSSMDDKPMKELYTASAIELVLAHVSGVQRVQAFDQTIRRAATSIKQNRPVRKVHVDQTPTAARLRAKMHLLPEEAAAVEKGELRLRIINVWRPLVGPVLDHPLCLAESASVPESDMVEVDHKYADRVGQTYAVRPREASTSGNLQGRDAAHRFWYLSCMEVTDVWLIQCFDSVPDASGRLLRCPHASFEYLEDSTDGCCSEKNKREGQLRASVEVRCLVLGG